MITYLLYRSNLPGRKYQPAFKLKYQEDGTPEIWAGNILISSDEQMNQREIPVELEFPAYTKNSSTYGASVYTVKRMTIGYISPINLEKGVYQIAREYAQKKAAQLNARFVDNTNKTPLPKTLEQKLKTSKTPICT